MFDIGFWELTVIGVIALIVLGPERLPVVARTLGTWVGRAKGYVRGLTSELEREIDVDDLRSQVRRAREQIETDTRHAADSVKNTAESVKNAADSVNDTVDPPLMTEKPSVKPDEPSAASPSQAPSERSHSGANPVADAAAHESERE